MTPATTVDKRDVTKPLVEQFKADAQIKADDGHTALFEAVYMGDVAVLKQLLESGARVNSRDWNGQTALHLAVILREQLFS